MMKNPRITFGIILVAMSIALMVVLVMTKRKPNVYDHSKWDPVFELIRTADKVQTVATTFDNFSYDNPPKDLAQFLTEKEPGGQHVVKDIPVDKRSAFLSSFKKLPHDEEPRAACFCPHHFVFVNKGSERFVIAICFHCSAIWVHGTNTFYSGIRHSDGDLLAKAFGIDLGPHLVDAPCSYNPGSGNK